MAPTDKKITVNDREHKKITSVVAGSPQEIGLDHLISGTKIKNKAEQVLTSNKHVDVPIVPDDEYENQLLRPLPFMDNETAELARIIQRDIFVKNPNVRWKDVAGQSDSKRILREAVIWPLRYPRLANLSICNGQTVLTSIKLVYRFTKPVERCATLWASG
jgi:SpoVK/Ycf46/Vps4 family AAA+-type ATPase